MDLSQIELIEKYAHILQVGARNMQNFTLLRELGRTRTPIMLKRGISAIPVVKQLCHLPVLVDPSHGTGRRDKVTPMARAAVAAGADGLLIEVHCDPDHALSDGAQSLFPSQFDRLMAELRIIAPAIGRSICVEPVARRGWSR
jgi:3-deoxy-7-phosphoheptulonate synthase